LLARRAVRAAIAAESALVRTVGGVLLSSRRQRIRQIGGEVKEKRANRNLRNRVTELLRAVDEELIRLVVLRRLVTDTHTVANRFNRTSELLRQEVRKVMVVRPLLPEEVLRAKGGRPVDCERDVLARKLASGSGKKSAPVVPPPKVEPARTLIPPSSVVLSPPSSYSLPIPSFCVPFISSGLMYSPFSTTRTFHPFFASSAATTPPPAPDPTTSISV
jgi:hypothetical protein